MKPRVIVSIILCGVIVLVTSGFTALINYISVGGHPGTPGESFAPVNVMHVSDEEDVIVNVYPTGGMLPHGYDKEAEHVIPLNSIRKGWLVAQYQGNCRVLFEVKDADMEDFCGIGNTEHYYYAEIIPRSRLSIRDITARLKDEPSDPFASDKGAIYFDCCIREELLRYNLPRHSIPFCLAVNAVFILLAVGINLIANAVEKRR